MIEKLTFSFIKILFKININIMREIFSEKQSQ